MDMSTENGASISMYIDGAEFTGDWANVDVKGVISIEIVYTSPQLPSHSLPANEQDEIQDGRLPGFTLVMTSIAVMAAFVVGLSRIEE